MNKTKAVRIKKTDNQLVKLTAVNSGTTIRKTLEGMILKSYVKHIEVTTCQTDLSECYTILYRTLI